MCVIVQSELVNMNQNGNVRACECFPTTHHVRLDGEINVGCPLLLSAASHQLKPIATTTNSLHANTITTTSHSVQVNAIVQWSLQDRQTTS